MKNLKKEDRLKFDCSLGQAELERRMQPGSSSDVKTPTPRFRRRNGGAVIREKRTLLSTSSGEQLALDCFSDGSTRLGIPYRWKQKVAPVVQVSRNLFSRAMSTRDIGIQTSTNQVCALCFEELL